jgi:uncharacterized cupin superfamily protein
VSQSVLITSLAEVELEPAPIRPAWIKSGNPEARGALLATSKDKMAFKVVWECSPGVFDWHYDEDETVYVISGEVFITENGGPERRFGAGDMVYFSGGSIATWRITEHVRKFAIVRKTLPWPTRPVVRAVKKVARLLTGQSRFTQGLMKRSSTI